MMHVQFEGYVPAQIEEGNDLNQFIEICSKKEQYGQKARSEMRQAMEKCAPKWVYLDSIHEKGNFKAYCANLREQQELEREAEKAAYAKERRQQLVAASPRKTGSEVSEPDIQRKPSAAGISNQDG